MDPCLEEGETLKMYTQAVLLPLVSRNVLKIHGVRCLYGLVKKSIRERFDWLIVYFERVNRNENSNQIRYDCTCYSWNIQKRVWRSEFTESHPTKINPLLSVILHHINMQGINKTFGKKKRKKNKKEMKIFANSLTARYRKESPLCFKNIIPLYIFSLFYIQTFPPNSLFKLFQDFIPFKWNRNEEDLVNYKCQTKVCC